MQNVLADTGFFVGIFNQRDAYHGWAVNFLQSMSAPPLTTWPVVTEVFFFLNVTEKSRFLAFIQRGGLMIEEIPGSALEQINHIFIKYQDREVDLADASLIWLAEKTGITNILTVDRQDFEIYRLSRQRRFSILF